MGLSHLFLYLQLPLKVVTTGNPSHPNCIHRIRGVLFPFSNVGEYERRIGIVVRSQARENGVKCGSWNQP